MSSSGENRRRRIRRLTRPDGSLPGTATAILDTFRSFGGPVANEEVYGEFGDTSQDKKVTLPNEFFRETVHGGRSAHVHWVRSYASDLVLEGYLESLSKGVHVITDKGHQVLDGIPAGVKWRHRDSPISHNLKTKYRIF